MTNDDSVPWRNKRHGSLGRPTAARLFELIAAAGRPVATAELAGLAAANPIPRPARREAGDPIAATRIVEIDGSVAASTEVSP